LKDHGGVIMIQERRKILVRQLNNALELERKVIGVKFLYTEKEFEKADAAALKGFLPYCVMVKAACSGGCFKASNANFGCYGASISLNVMDIKDAFPEKGPEYYTCGMHYYNDFHVYKDLETARKTVQNVVICRRKAYGVMLKPLEKFTVDPDVVIIVSDSYNMMRLIQGYNYEFGTFSSYRIAGMQAICSETTAYPFENDSINISMLCAGTRQNSKWDRNEISMGIPYGKFEAVVNGVYKTINPLERDSDKKRIDANMKRTNQPVIDIEYGKNYDTGCYRFGKNVTK
jgi:uncharacterized protein (DUF169 family)